MMRNAHRTNALRSAILALVVAIGLFSGCGGGGGQTSSTVTTTPAAPAQWQYTALGDSLGVGILALQGYVPRYQQYVQTDTGVTITLRNLSVNGWTTSDLLNALRNDATFRTEVMNSQVVTFDIGGNDLLGAFDKFRAGTCGGSDNQDCFRAAVTTFVMNWDAIVAQVLALRGRSTTILRTMNVYDPFVSLENILGIFAQLKPYLVAVNDHIRASAAANGILMADVYAAFNGASGNEDPVAKGYISIDGVHPNDAGHKVMADLLRGLGYAPLK